MKFTFIKKYLTNLYFVYYKFASNLVRKPSFASSYIVLLKENKAR